MDSEFSWSQDSQGFPDVASTNIAANYGSFTGFASAAGTEVPPQGVPTSSARSHGTRARSAPSATSLTFSCVSSVPGSQSAIGTCVPPAFLYEVDAYVDTIVDLDIPVVLGSPFHRKPRP